MKDDLKTERLLIKISKEQKEKLKQLADKENRSMSNFLLNLLQKEIDKSGH